MSTENRRFVVKVSKEKAYHRSPTFFGRHEAEMRKANLCYEMKWK